LEEEISSREFQGYEAGRLDVSGNLLDEFGGKRGEVRFVGQVCCLVLPVRHFGSDLIVSLLLLMVVRMVRFLCCCNGGDVLVSSLQEKFVCLLLACLPVPSGRVGRLVSQSVYQVPAAKERLSRKFGLVLTQGVTDILL